MPIRMTDYYNVITAHRRANCTVVNLMYCNVVMWRLKYDCQNRLGVANITQMTFR